VPDSEGARIARLKERVNGVREDMTELVAEQLRHRTRLHNLEGISAAFIDQQREARRAEARQYRRLERNLQVLTVVIAIAAIVTPILIALLTGK
jgi:hypothetical protein